MTTKNTIECSVSLMSPEAERAHAQKTVDSFIAIRNARGANGPDGIAAMQRVAGKILGHQHGTALWIRRLLLSLFGNHRVRLAGVQSLDPTMRYDIATILLTVGGQEFPDFLIRDIFIAKGDCDGKWFFGGLEKADFKVSPR